MGRHSAPPSGERDPRRPLYLAVTAAVVVLAFAVVALTLALRGGDGRTTADPGNTRRPSTGAPSSAALASAGSLDPSASASASDTTATRTPTPTPSSSSSASSAPATSVTAKPRRPPTLRLVWLGTSYVRVQVGGGRTVFEDIEHKGTVRTFDQHRVTALIGNAAQVRAVVNGKARKRGGSGQVATIVARR